MRDVSRSITLRHNKPMLDFWIPTPHRERYVVRGRERLPVRVENKVDRSAEGEHKSILFDLSGDRIGDPDFQPSLISSAL